jgi:hypothetical protein
MTATNILATKAMAALLALVSITASHLAKIVHLRPAAKPTYENGATFCLPRAAHPNAKPNANCSLELQTMNYSKGHLFAGGRVEFSFRALVDRTIREQNREERRLAEQRATKHQFHARNSCILDGRNYRVARRLLLFPGAQF